MNGENNPNRLIVEGIADKQAVLGVIRAHTDWPMQPRPLDQVPVFIYPGGGVSKILGENSMVVSWSDHDQYDQTVLDAVR